MKRKFYLLALACAVVGTSVISSCKDTDEDLYNNLKNQLAQNDGAFKQLQADLSAKLNDLEAKLAEKMKEQGPKGDKGDTGATGATGEAGAAGLSAYEIAVKNGFTGTEEEWLLSLKGEKGDPGQDAAISVALEAIEALRGEQNKSIEELKDLIKKLEAAMSSLDIASVIVQNVYNPAFGYVALPLGVQSNVLMSYYSNEASSQKFPVPYGFDENGLTDDELAALGMEAKRYDLTKSTSFVGNVYLTVNPINTDFSGKTPKLVNSKGEESGIALSALEVCDEELTFGYTRAASTGLYVSEANISDFDAAEKINLNAKEKAKQIIDATKGEGNDLSKIVRIVYETINNVCARKAIQLSSDKNNTVVSEYGIAAAIVKPMGFQTLESLCGSSPIEKLQKAINSVNKKISDRSVTAALNAASSFVDQLYDRSLPAIVAEDSNFHIIMSIDPANPTLLVEKSVKLHAVSLCAETLVPYAMKHIAVTKVVNADGTLNEDAAKEANAAANMNKVLSDKEAANSVAELTNLVSGATYEIAYSVMDYAGETKVLRFYFTVK